MQRFLQAEPSWFRSGQTTTLFSSDTEKDPVSEARGGIPSCIYPGAGGRAKWAKGRGTTGAVRGVQWQSWSSGVATGELWEL